MMWINAVCLAGNLFACWMQARNIGHVAVVFRHVPLFMVVFILVHSLMVACGNFFIAAGAGADGVLMWWGILLAVQTFAYIRGTLSGVRIGKAEVAEFCKEYGLSPEQHTDVIKRMKVARKECKNGRKKRNNRNGN